MDESSVLVPTESLEECAEQLMSGTSQLPEAASHPPLHLDSNIRDATKDMEVHSGDVDSQSNDTKSNNNDDYLHNPEWLGKDKHVFILSSAGKPIYSRYGNEDKLAGLCGVIQALISVINNSGKDTIRSIHTSSCTVVFFIKGPLILAAVSKVKEDETQLVLQLTYVFNQIISVLSLTQLTRIFEQRRNYDLRRLLSGAERLIDHLLNSMEKDPAFILGAVRCLPLAQNMRDSITNAIISACNKIKDLVFAILLTGDQLITLVRMKKYTLHPSDIHLIINLVKSSESFKTAESWTPICLPKFDSSGFLHGHVSYLSEDCQACLMLLTVQRDAFFVLSQAKHTITEKLRRSNCLEAINDAILGKKVATSKSLQQIGIPEMRHFIYKCRKTAQLFSSNFFENNDKSYQQDINQVVMKVFETSKGKISSNKINLPNFVNNTSNIVNLDNWKIPSVNYLDNYKKVCAQLHCSAQPAKLIYRLNSENTVLAWVTLDFELYVTFDPLVEKNSAIAAVDKLLKWINKEQDKLFIMNAPTF